ncbi:unnamed protein product, partial [Symbiodinium sp. CCMP2456]
GSAKKFIEEMSDITEYKHAGDKFWRSGLALDASVTDITTCAAATIGHINPEGMDGVTQKLHEVVNSCSEIYLKAKFLGQQAKPALETLKQAHHIAKTEWKGGVIFRVEGLLLAILLENDQTNKVRLARKEIAGLAGNTRGIGADDVHVAIYNSVKNLLPS